MCDASAPASLEQLELVEFPTVPADVAAVALDAIREGRNALVTELLAPLELGFVLGPWLVAGDSLADVDPFQRARWPAIYSLARIGRCVAMYGCIDVPGSGASVLHGALPGEPYGVGAIRG